MDDDLLTRSVSDVVDDIYGVRCLFRPAQTLISHRALG